MPEGWRAVGIPVWIPMGWDDGGDISPPHVLCIFYCLNIVPVIATVAPQTLDEQVTRYFNDVVDHTDETLGEMYTLAMAPLGRTCFLSAAVRTHSCCRPSLNSIARALFKHDGASMVWYSATPDSGQTFLYASTPALPIRLSKTKSKTWTVYLEGASIRSIRFRKPKRVSGLWDATLVPRHASYNSGTSQYPTRNPPTVAACSALSVTVNGAHTK